MPFRRAASWLLALGALWLLLPPPLGFGLRPVVVRGSSMAPAIEPGDLALVAPAGHYLPGQVVAYRSRDLGGAVLLHRVRGYDGEGRLITRGDANGFDDSYRPAPEEVLGVMRLRLPLAGRALAAAMSPPAAASLAGAAAATAVAARRRRLPAVGPTPLLAGLFLGAAALSAGAALLLAGATLSATVTVERAVSYQHRGQWDYSAPALAPIYDGGAVARSGDPLFWRLSRPLTVSFAYRPPPVVEGVSGSLVLYARLGDYLPTGWRRTLPIAGPAALSEDGAKAEGVLDLAAVRELWQEVMAAIGQEAFSPARLELVARVTVDGSLAGQPFHDEALFSLPFRLDQVGAALEPPREGTPAELLSPTVDRTATARVVEERRLAAGPLSLGLEEGREVGRYLLWGGGALLAAAVAFLLLASRSPAGLASLMGARVVRVDCLPAGAREAAVAASVGDIVQASRATGSPVLADRRGALMVVSPAGCFLLPVSSKGRKPPREGARP